MSGPTLVAGRVLGRRYQLARLLARGGMAEVWEGYDETLSRPVAVKILKNDLADDAIFVERFRREAVTAARLGHHAIVATYDAGVDAGTAYIVMELVQGRTLRQLLTSTGALDPALAVGIATQIADALAYAHRCGLIHRDVKPANVLLCDEEGVTPQVKVTDFGIAKTTAEFGQDLTATGTVLGTPKYFSPEQVEGRHEPDARSDLYALGVVLFEMLTGRVPFDGPTEMATALAHLRDPPPSVTALRPAVPPAVDVLVQKFLAKSPADRPPTAVAARQALEVLSRDLAAARVRGSRGQYRGVGAASASTSASPATDRRSTTPGQSSRADQSSPGGRSSSPGRSTPVGRPADGNDTGYPLPIGSRGGPGRDPLGAPALNGPVGAGGWTPLDRTVARPFPDGRGGRPVSNPNPNPNPSPNPSPNPNPNPNPGAGSRPPTGGGRRAQAPAPSPTPGPPHPDTARATSSAPSYAAWARGPGTGARAYAPANPGRTGSHAPVPTPSSSPSPPTRGIPPGGTSSRASPAVGPAPSPVATPRRTTRRNGRFVAVLVTVIAAAALVVGAVLLFDQPSSAVKTKPRGAIAPPVRPVKIQAVSVWMDNDRPPDNTNETKFTIDGKASTFWQTVPYRGPDKATFSGLYSGEGLAIELSARHSVGRLTVTSSTQGWAASTYVSDSKPATGAPVGSWGRPTAAHATIDGNATFNLEGRKGRWVLLWLTDIGPLGQATINELTITS